MENWCEGDWDETKNDAHVMRRKGCALQNQGVTLNLEISRHLADYVNKVHAIRAAQ